MFIKKRYWHTWFAWYPIAFGSHIVWLKTIQRKWIPEPKANNFDFGYWIYRLNEYVI